MTDYSIQYLDDSGRTQSSDFREFKDNRAAVKYARIGLVSHAYVEIWRGVDLVDRLRRSDQNEGEASKFGKPTDDTLTPRQADADASRTTQDRHSGSAHSRAVS